VSAAVEIRRLPIGRGARWIVDAFDLFRRQALPWIVVHLGLMLIAMGLMALKIVGMFLLLLLLPIFIGGLMAGCRDQENGQVVEIAHLFRGFRVQATALVTVGGLYLVGQVVIAGITMAVGGQALQELMNAAVEGADPAQIDPATASQAYFATLIGSALFVPLAMAVWFAPALVVLDGLPAWRAMHLSLRACVRNVLPFLLYSVAMFGLFVVAMVPLMLGLVLWVPLAMLSVYAAYRDIFGPDAVRRSSAADPGKL
jgi:uncharacterized membrane protein